MDCQDDHQQQQGAHHHFGDPFDAFFQPHVADHKAQKAGQEGPEAHGKRMGQHGLEGALDEGGGLACKGPFQMEPAVIQHPAGDGGVVQHQQGDPGDADVLQPGPAAAGGSQPVEAPGHALAAAPAQGEFAQEHGYPQDQQEQEIQENEGGSAVLAAQVGEFPHIADADGTAGADQDETQTGLEGITGALLF